MKNLFEPVAVGGLLLKNRFIRSATFENAFTENETFTAKLWPVYEKLAANGVAAIITGMAGIDENSRLTPAMIKTYGQTFVPELTRLVENVHKLETKLIVQICHCGQKAAQIDAGGPPLGPCDAETSRGRIRGMTCDEICAVAQNFAAAALRCKQAGADAVQLHAAHGFLLSQFLNPYFNKRTDEYGGAIENRARIVMEVYDAVRTAVGDDYPIWIKINARDLTELSITPEEFLWVCQKLDKRGVNAIEVSGGAALNAKSASTPLIADEADEGYFAREALEAAKEVAASIISVCGYRTPGVIEKWLNAGGIDAVSLCRPLISEPGLASRWERGDLRKARCISCNQCFNPQLECKAFSQNA